MLEELHGKGLFSVGRESRIGRDLDEFIDIQLATFEEDLRRFEFSRELRD